MTATPLTPEPRWPALLAILISSLVFLALPDFLSPGPSWLPIVLVTTLELPALFLHYRGYFLLNRILGYSVSALLTLFTLAATTLLIISLPAHKESPVPLLRSAALLWASNILTFALWYWRLDAGGPHDRDRRSAHTQGAFLFPQMTLRPAPNWSPYFVDYLFLAFNTSTAFSPTDVPILSRWAKILVMLQSAISLTILAILAARAINIM